MKTTRILLVSHELSLTGAPASLLRQAGYLRDTGCEVVLWTYRRGPLLESFELIGVRCDFVDDDYADIRRRVEVLTPRPDVVICNTWKTYRSAVAFAARGLPTVWFIREMVNLEGPLIANRDFAQAFRGFYNLYTVSHMAAGFIRLYNPDVRWFGNSVPDVFEGFPARMPGKLRFGFIGSVNPRKGLAELIQAFMGLSTGELVCELRIAGGYQNCDEGLSLRRLTAERKDIIWLGTVQCDRKREFFRSVDVLCVPSLDEPFGLTVLEGAMWGRALLVSDRVGAKDLVDETCGTVVDVRQLRQGLEWFLSRYSKLEVMQRAARGRYLTFGTPERERKAVLEMVADALSHPPPPSARDYRIRRQLFKKEDVDEDHWRVRIFEVTVLKCRKMRFVKIAVRLFCGLVGIDPKRMGFASEVRKEMLET